MVASAYPVEGTLIGESTARELIGAIKANTAAIIGFRQDLNGPRGVNTRIHQLVEQLEAIFDPETALVKRAAVLSDIDRKLEKVLAEAREFVKHTQSLAGTSPAAPAVPAESP